jgi:GR25 family glycosyltransferase involved in LPS biosynthesis
MTRIKFLFMKAFIIRLKNNLISEKYASLCVDQASRFGVRVDFFDAINGIEYHNHLKILDLFPKYKFKKGRPGVFGCFLSHYYLWRKCVDDNVPYIILEHDGYFIKPLPKNILDSFLDVLKLDNLDPYSKLYSETLESQIDFPLIIEKYYNPSAKFLEKNQTGNYMRGAYSYIIKPHAAKKIIDWVSINGFVPADQQIGDNIVDIQVTIPTIVRLHPDYQNKISELSLTGNMELL